jgi:hypothetical protein
VGIAAAGAGNVQLSHCLPDFVNKKPSKYFVVTILVVKGHEANRSLINSVKKTLRRKLNPKNIRKRIILSDLKRTGRD